MRKKLQNLYNFRNDLHDISDEEIKNIRDRELLIVELKHTNNFLQSKEKTVNTFSIMVLSVLGILLYHATSSMITFFEFSKNIKTKDVEYLKLNLPIFVYLLIGFTVIFIFMVIIDLYNRYRIIKRKNLILNEIKKLQSIDTTKHSKKICYPSRKKLEKLEKFRYHCRT